jgi:hypothetical protein
MEDEAKVESAPVNPESVAIAPAHWQSLIRADQQVQSAQSQLATMQGLLKGALYDLYCAYGLNPSEYGLDGEKQAFIRVSKGDGPKADNIRQMTPQRKKSRK